MIVVWIDNIMLREDEKGEFKRRYLDENTLSTLSVDFDFRTVEFASNDTINEENLYNAVLNCDFKEELLVATLQMAIIGFGGRQYNQYKYKGEFKDLKELFKKFGVHYNNQLGEKLETVEFTPRRLLRIFRYQIYNYLVENPEVSSYLFTKYTGMDLKYRITCFPGAEHLVTKVDDAAYLLSAYKRLDASLENRRQDHGIVKRIERVLLARQFNIFELENFVFEIKTIEKMERQL